MTSKVYASGETPMVGDVVRRDEAPWFGVAVGDVAAVREVRDLGQGIKLDRGDDAATHSTCTFTLIARAGEPVEYRPGDVVEGVEEPIITAVRPGRRYVIKAPENGGKAPTIDLDGDRRFIGKPAENVRASVRLVHRPDAPVIATPDAPPIGVPLTEGTAKLLRAGDLVRAEWDDTSRCGGWAAGDVLTITEGGSSLVRFVDKDGDLRERRAEGYTFIGRPDAEGWVAFTTWPEGLDVSKFEFKSKNGNVFGGIPNLTQTDNAKRHESVAITAFRLLPADEAPKISAIADVARDLRPGARVRVTVEGRVNPRGDVVTDAGPWLHHQAVPHATAIEVIADAPLAVGDRVVGPFSDDVGVIRHIAHECAAVEFDDDFRMIVLKRLGRAG
jgi:hypothetical protein